MNCVFLAGAATTERATLCRLLEERHVKVVGESANWSSVLHLGPTIHPDVVAVDWSLIANRQIVAMKELRADFPAAVLIIFPNLMEASRRADLIYASGDYNQKGPGFKKQSRSIKGTAI